MGGCGGLPSCGRGFGGPGEDKKTQRANEKQQWEVVRAALAPPARVGPP